jgi:magnesium chelatase family protein
VLASARTFCLLGVSAREVAVEVDVHRGLPAFSIVGLPDPAVRESRERVRAALANCGFKFPLHRITANLAPADLRKAGPGFDLAIAAALLAASDQIGPGALDGSALAGELALDGSVRPIPGVLAMAEEARRLGIARLAVAAENAGEAALIDGIAVLPLTRIDELRRLAEGGLVPFERSALVTPARNGQPDLADLRGQPYLRRALEVAAAGGHSMLITGPPGAGKSLAARRLPSIMPPLATDEAIEVTRIASVCGRGPARGRLAERPFRAPHHTISPAGLVGGGSPPRPGEVTLAHRGVLFLDELGEFSRAGLEALRQPLEEGRVTVVRAAHAVELPCRFLLVAAANPCPCGRGQESEACKCGPESIRRYGAKLSGALADRIDISLWVDQPSAEQLGSEEGEPSTAIRDRVITARERQARRLGPGRCNGQIDGSEVRRRFRLERDARALLASSHQRLGLSGRGYERVVRVARTVADLAGSDTVREGHVEEAVTLRRRDGALNAGR